MNCATGGHTVTISNDNEVYSFGRNDEGQLGMSELKLTCNPTLIQNLKKIKQVSCGFYFTVCLDEDGFLWSFGKNNYGQCGNETIHIIYSPYKIQYIPLIQRVCCGGYHTLAIDNENSEIWSFGRNYGQLCINHIFNCSVPQNTLITNIIQISAGALHSLFQDSEGKVFGCGFNEFGALTTTKNPQIQPCLIHNQPPNIIQFACGFLHSLFLDVVGNVFCAGFNQKGNLGIGNHENQSELVQIPNIPLIQEIYCCTHSSYLIDFERNLWSFGDNTHGQLGIGNKKSIKIPTKVSTVKDIKQVSVGSTANHILLKDGDNRIFVLGNRSVGQLITRDSSLTPLALNSYSNIWAPERSLISGKSAIMFLFI